MGGGENLFTKNAVLLLMLNDLECLLKTWGLGQYETQNKQI